MIDKNGVLSNIFSGGISEEKMSIMYDTMRLILLDKVYTYICLMGA